MDRTEPPSRPLLTPRHEGNANASDGDTLGVSYSSSSNTPVDKERENISRPERVQKRSISLKEISKSLLAFPSTIAGYLVRGGKRLGNVLVRRWSGRWTAEACSLFFALLSLLGLVITLLAHQSRPLPQWPRLLTINSIISLFSFFIRAGVGVVLAEGISQSKWQWFRKARRLQDMERFDLASRSAWGSVQLLINLNMTQPYLIAALGACITIMAALTGFITQQLIQFEECLSPDNNASVRIERANYYSAFGIHHPTIIHDEFVPMAVAIDVGILQPVEDLTIILSRGCSTGNCTFPTLHRETFSTLAIGHSCEDVTSQVTKVPITQSNTWTLDEWAVQEGDFDVEYNTTRRKYILSLPMSETEAPLTFAIADWPGAMVTGVARNSTKDSIATLKVIVRPDHLNSSLIEQFSAISCSLYPVVNTYAARISKSILIEELIRSVPVSHNKIPVWHSEWINNYGPAYKMGTTWTISGGSQVTCERRESLESGYEAVAEPNIVHKDGPIERTGSVNETRIWYLPQECVWGFSGETSYMMYDYLNKTFGSKWLGDELFVMESSMHLRRLYERQNTTLESVDWVIANLTRSMTSIVRAFGAYSVWDTAYPTRDIGTMWYPATCIQIRWPWITFPVSLIALSVIFLVLVHVESRGTDRERLWKSSTFAVLFCEMDSEVADKAQPVRKQALKDVAKSTSVSLNRDSERLRLITRGS